MELPGAVGLIMGGLRLATLQVIATAIIAAYVGLGGLGRFIIDGQAARDYPQMIAGAVVIAVVAIVVELVLQLVGRLVTPGPERLRLWRRPGSTPTPDTAPLRPREARSTE